MATTPIFLTAGDGEHLDVLGSSMTFLATGAQTDDAYEVVVVSADASGEPISHRHPWTEFYVVLDGTLEVKVAGRERLAGPGAFVTIPSMAVHSFEVVSEKATFLHVSIGAGATATFREYNTAVPGTPQPDDVPELLAINERHGVEVVLPGLGVIRSLEDLGRLGDLTEIEDLSELAGADRDETGVRVRG